MEFKILGHNIQTDNWDNLGIVTASTSRGANQKAHKQFGEVYYEFLVTEAK